jgi:hypothetical protein
MGSLLASAVRLTGKTMNGGTFRKASNAGWQEDAWEMYDLVGEQRFLASTLAGTMSKARFYVGKLGEGADATDAPEPVDDNRLQSLLDAVGSTASGKAQLVQRLGVNLFVAGDAWLIGIPPYLMPGFVPDPNEDIPQFDPEVGVDMSDLTWRLCSVTEVTMNRAGLVQLQLGDSAAEKVEVSPDEVFMIRVWRPHPRRWWEADSPTRSSLPVLRELVGLTMHISAQVDSRLAGAGVLLVPSSASRALKAASGIPDDSSEDPFTEGLMEAMLRPIGDRSNASALVPLVSSSPTSSRRWRCSRMR